jgi:hypothetical protein
MDNVTASRGWSEAPPGRSCPEAWRNLPKAYLSFLQNSNGAEAYDGYFRIFGFGPKAKTDAIEWNRESLWKFAWPRGVNKYWCFGGTAWGDQYAFKQGDASPRVYRLDGLSMKPRLLEENFDTFFHEYFLQNATIPDDEMTVRARKKFGPLDASVQIVYSPSPFLTGSKNIDSVMKMPAAAAMVLNGDIYTQLGRVSPSRLAKTIEPYKDNKGRMRLRVVWLDD